MTTSSPYTKSADLIGLEDKYELVDTLGGGTDAMREEGVKYLPREPGETSENYTRRLSRSVLFPAYSDAIVANTGKIFRHGMEVTGTTPLITPLLESIDEEGSSVETFAQRACANAIDYGCSYILVDYPVVTPNATLQDERDMGVQPYWVLIDAPQVLEASPIRYKGKNKLGVFRFIEKHAFRSSEFELSFQERVKEFRVVSGEDGTPTVIYRVFIQQDKEWVLFDEGVLLGMTEIPVAPMYTKKVGFYLGSPLLYELAVENVLNWQIQSDHQNLVHITSVPMLQVTGATSQFDDNGVKQEIVISPNTVLEFTNPDAEAKWVEVTGSATSQSRQAVQDSNERMSELSLEALTTVSIDQTATAALLDAEESVSVLQVLQYNVEQAINEAIVYTYMYLGADNTGTTVSLIVADPVTANETSNEGDTATPVLTAV